MWCADPTLNLLMAFGYNVIRLPKADVQPLQILTRRGNDLDRLGNLTTLLVAGPNVALPPVSRDVPTANISGQRTSDLKIGIGLSILGNVLGAMGGSKLGLEGQYAQAKTIAFEFPDVLEDKVEVAELDKYLGNADVNPFSRYVADLLEASELYVTTATIKTRKLTVDAQARSKKGLALDVPAIQGVVGGNVKVSQEGGAASKLTYEGSVPLVFGFQAVRLYYTDGRYTAFEPLPPGVGMKALDKAPQDKATRLAPAGAFVRFRGDD